jgi:hypothetical protein
MPPVHHCGLGYLITAGESVFILGPGFVSELARLYQRSPSRGRLLTYAAWVVCFLSPKPSFATH